MAVDLDLLEAAERLIHIKKGISQNGHIVLHQTLEALKQNKHDTKSQKVFEILINSRINLSAHNQSGQSPLHFTIMHHLIEEGCALLEHLSPEEINHSNSNGITAVHQAVLSDNQALLDKLVAIQGIQLDSTDHSGDTPLITAITTDNIECAETLLDAGANIDQSDHTGDSPLHHALMVNDETFIALVLDYEPSLNNSNFRGFTPLHLAATMEQPDELYQLLNYIDSAEVLEQTTHDYDAFTALQLAVEHNLGSNVKALIEYGADHSVTDRDGKNLLNLALERRTQSSNSAFSALIGLNLTFPLRDDTENAHDANINHTFCIYLNRIKDEVEDSMHLSEEETLRELKERITAQDAHSALRVLASIEEEGNHPIAHLSSDQEAGTETERSVLSWVYSYIFTQPENQQAALIDSLITRLADGYDTEKQDIVCRNGKVNRILDTFTGILPGFSVVSIDLIRKEMIESAAHIREQMIKDQPHKVQRALTSKRTTQVQERVLERFQAALKERIKAQLFQTYVNGGILSEDRFNNLLKEWIDYIH